MAAARYGRRRIWRPPEVAAAGSGLPSQTLYAHRLSLIIYEC